MAWGCCWFDVPPESCASCASCPCAISSLSRKPTSLAPKLPSSFTCARLERLTSTVLFQASASIRVIHANCSRADEGKAILKHAGIGVSLNVSQDLPDQRSQCLSHAEKIESWMEHQDKCRLATHGSSVANLPWYTLVGSTRTYVSRLCIFIPILGASWPCGVSKTSGLIR
jgi:hypothetical protein